MIHPFIDVAHVLHEEFRNCFMHMAPASPARLQNEPPTLCHHPRRGNWSMSWGFFLPVQLLEITRKPIEGLTNYSKIATRPLEQLLENR